MTDVYTSGSACMCANDMSILKRIIGIVIGSDCCHLYLFNLTDFGRHPKESESKVKNRAPTLTLFPDRVDTSAIRPKYER